jgi:hypothetical protein
MADFALERNMDRIKEDFVLKADFLQNLQHRSQDNAEQAQKKKEQEEATTTKFQILIAQTNTVIDKVKQSLKIFEDKMEMELRDRPRARLVKKIELDLK